MGVFMQMLHLVSERGGKWSFVSNVEFEHQYQTDLTFPNVDSISVVFFFRYKRLTGNPSFGNEGEFVIQSSLIFNYSEFAIIKIGIISSFFVFYRTKCTLL